ncbi:MULTISPECIES: hypothetical protein [Fictibacillus]|nr:MULTISPECIES: hypothetical protein [unclassified Fictibacillus]MBH0155539.1 hypothetical protein [Fictibacillus sp. 5RED26]MBH0164666.1 hypothetical protein [Fictibacillus sp. 7GRE50]
MWYKESSLFKLQQYTIILHKLGIFSQEDKVDILGKIQKYKLKVGLKD